MIPRNHCLCPRHKGIIDMYTPVFYDDEKGIAMAVQRDDTITILPTKEDLHTRDYRATLLRAKKKGVIHSVDVRYKDNTLATLNRKICPVCFRKNQVHYLDPQAGLYPTYLVVLTGSPATGKSCYIEAATQDLVMDKLSAALNGRGSVLAFGNEARHKVYDPNKLSEALRSRSLVVTGKRGRIKVFVQLLDTAGELLVADSSNPAATQLKELVAHTADALLVVHDYRAFTISPDVIQQVKEANKALVGSVGNLLTYVAIVRGRAIPVVANVITHADLIQQAAYPHGVYRDGDNDSVPIIAFDSPLFREEGGPIRTTILRHLALAEDLVVEAGIRNQGSYPTFVVSCGKPTGTKNGFNFNLARNADLPILFILHQLGLIRL